MSELFGMCSDGPSSPEIRLLQPPTDGTQSYGASGWGIGWYPSGEVAAAVVKDPLPTGEVPLGRVLRDWERFRSTLFVGHIRGAAKRARQEDTHPFQRSYGARDWLIGHDGDLDVRQLAELRLGEPPVFEPVGATDSEYMLCWLLTQLRERGARSLGELGYEVLHGMLRELNQLGTLSLLMSDGEDLIAYSCQTARRGLWLARRHPPHVTNHLSSPFVDIDLSESHNATRTNVLVSSTPLQPTDAARIEPGELVVIRLGAVVWRSTEGSAPMHSVMPPPPQSRRGPPSAPLLHMGLVGGSARRTPVGSAGGLLGPLSAGERTFEVVHETVYRYDAPVELSSHFVRLRPVDDIAQDLLSYSLEVTPPGQSYSFDDVFGNHTVRLKLRSSYDELRLVARSKLRVKIRPEPLQPLRRTTIPLIWMPWQRQMMAPYLLPPELPESELKELSTFAMSFALRNNYDLIDTLRDMNLTIYRDFKYVSRSTTVETTPWEVYVGRVGVCQDFANLFICLAQLLGVPARYRVGYIFTGGDYENKIQSEASHAWAELYLPRVGWRGFDPTNGCLVGVDHLRVACGRNYRDATPTSGTIFKGGGRETLTVGVRVETATERSAGGSVSGAGAERAPVTERVPLGGTEALRPGSALSGGSGTPQAGAPEGLRRDG